jgi:hypothetical protein
MNIQEYPRISKNIQSMAFFDIFDLPVVSPAGFSYLPGREGTVANRQTSVRHIDRKLRIARRACALLRWVPFVDAVFACNTVAMGNADDASDIDVLVIVRDKRLWLTRLLVTIVLSLAGLRRHGNSIRDRVCLSFYLTPAAFHLSAIAIPQDVYLAYWLRTLVPLFDPEHIFDTLQEKNSWADAMAPRVLPFQTAPRIRTDPTQMSRLWRMFWERAWGGQYGDMLERQAKAIQRPRIKPHGNAVVVSDAMMKFHENDRREEYRNLWRKKLLQC